MKIRLIGKRNHLGIGIHFANFADAFRRMSHWGLCVEEFDCEDPQALEAEAERLHLTPEDVKRIMAKVSQEVRTTQREDLKGLPPDILLEKYRQQLSHLQVLALSDDAARLEALIADPLRTTLAEQIGRAHV